MHNPGRDPLCVGEAVHAFANYGELIAAHSCNDVTGPDEGAQTTRDLYEHRVAGRMSPGVVDGLEAIEIHVQHGNHRF